MCEPSLWALYDRPAPDEPEKVVGYEGEDAGMVMLHIMQNHPDLIVDEYLDWLSLRRKRGLMAVRGFFNRTVSDMLLEDYLEFVNRIAERDSCFRILDGSLSIKRVTNDA